MGNAYGEWDGLLQNGQLAIFHDAFADGLWIVFLMLLAFLINRMVERLSGRVSLEQKQKATLEAIIRITVRAVIVVIILLMLFGKPSQLSTVLGLAGAGLTVVLKDFIVSFLGWFVLMGRQGIRVGDSVEINGVRGEVIEITLLRTVLLETGNWTDPGHPTGRQVAFLNQYAIDGYYFNFSTSGQWLWDELQVNVPAGKNPYPLVESIREITAKETESNTHLAEREWQRVSKRYGVRSFSAQPTVTIKPTDLGVNVIVRYITRADDRTDTRIHLNQAIVQVLQSRPELVPGGEVLVGGPPSGDG